MFFLCDKNCDGLRDRVGVSGHRGTQDKVTEYAIYRETSFVFPAKTDVWPLPNGRKSSKIHQHHRHFLSFDLSTTDLWTVRTYISEVKIWRMFEYQYPKLPL